MFKYKVFPDRQTLFEADFNKDITSNAVTHFVVVYFDLIPTIAK